MPSFNKVFLMGNLTRDPQLKQLPSNLVVAEFGLACNRRFRNAAGEEREEVTFVDCTAFGRQAETVGQFCTKGKPLFVEGRLKFDSWDDKQGHGKRNKLSVVVENFQFIGARDGVAAAPDASKADQQQSFLDASQPGRTERLRRGKAQQPFGDEPQFVEADIPF
jgi:single-strand DNA-binding protein